MKYDNYEGLLVNFAFVVMKDELDEEGLKEELSNVVDVLEVNEPPEDNEVKVFILRGTLADYLLIKLNYNCLEHPDNKYVLFPMASLEEKIKARRMLNDQ